MAQSIKQEKLFKSSPNKLYQFYMDDKIHSDITGKKAKIGNKAGDTFSAFSGDIKGKILHTIRNQLIVQTWRYKNWDKSVMDSIVTITFIGNEDGSTKVSLYQSNIPEEHLEAVKKGWNGSYWNAWKKHIEQPPIKAAKTTKTTKKTKQVKKAKSAPVKKTSSAKRTKKVIPNKDITIT